MSTISSGTTLTTALVQTGDTTGDLVIRTGASNTTAMTVSGTDQSVTFAGTLTANTNASTITTGTVPTARLATGTANSSTYLRGDQTWAAVPAATPGGSTTQVQFNNAGAFGGSANLTFNGTTLTTTDITDSSLTPGRVVFPTTGGNLTGSADLFWDSANARLGVGTASPQNQLHILGTTTGYARFQSTNRTFTIGSLASAFGFVINDVDAGQERMRIDAGGLFMFDSGYGSAATAYGCRAWVNFNGTGTVAIRSSGNVSSITDLGTGSYRLNFSNAMPDANYNVVGASTSAVGVSATFLVTTFRRDTDTRVSNTTSGTTFSTCGDNSVAQDVADVNVSVFR